MLVDILGKVTLTCLITWAAFFVAAVCIWNGTPEPPKWAHVVYRVLAASTFLGFVAWVLLVIWSD